MYITALKWDANSDRYLTVIQTFSGSKPKSNTKTSGQRQCLWERVRVNLLVSDNSRKTRSTHPKQNSYLVKIALIKERSLSVEIHEWNVKDNQATVRTSKIKNSHFAKSSTLYTNLGETKNGKHKC